MSERDDLRALVVELADARSRYEEARVECERREAAFKLANETIFLAADQAKTLRDDIEGQIRARQYSGIEKAPAPGLSVKMVTTVNYTPSTAFGWAVENQHHNLLTLNARAFEQVAKGLRLDFVIIGAVPQVTIARDLAPAAARIGVEMAVEWRVEAQGEVLKVLGYGPWTDMLVGQQDVIGSFEPAAKAAVE